jgi:hypothetical protein
MIKHARFAGHSMGETTWENQLNNPLNKPVPT